MVRWKHARLYGKKFQFTIFFVKFIYFLFINLWGGRIWKDILKNTLCIFAAWLLSSVPHKSAIRRIWSLNLPPQSGVWNDDVKKNNFLAIFCFHFDWLYFFKKKKGFCFCVLIYIYNSDKRKKTQIQSEIQFDIGAIGLGF